MILIGALDGTLYGLDKSGQIRFQHPCSSPIRIPVSIDIHNRRFVGTELGELLAFSQRGVPLWRYPMGTAPRGAFAFGSKGEMFVGGENGTLYAFKE